MLPNCHQAKILEPQKQAAEAENHPIQAQDT